MIDKLLKSSTTIVLIGLSIGILVGYEVLSLNMPWLVISLAFLAGLVAWGQTPCIQVYLHTPDKNKAQNKFQKPFPCLKRWLVRLTVYLVLVIILVLADSWWWTRQPIIMNLFAGEKEGSLPLSYALKKPFWQFGLFSLPEMIEIPAGSFEMGSEKESLEETQKQKVNFQRVFLMSKYEISFAEYDYYVWSMKKAQKKVLINYPFDQNWGRDTKPVINVSWEDAQGYVNWFSKKTDLSCRLPSESEWEYAARAGGTTYYFWGNKIGENRANCAGCGSKWDGTQTAPVGSFGANKWGLHDMHGNVWEWVQDCYQNNNTASADGSARESEKCGFRSVRGGSWSKAPNALQSSFRSGINPVDRVNNLGFRIVCTPPSDGD